MPFLCLSIHSLEGDLGNRYDTGSMKTGAGAILRRYFIAGLLAIVPIWGTYLILHALFETLEGVLGPFLQNHGVYVPGLGVIVLLAIVLLVGMLASNFLGKRLLLMGEAWMKRVPLVRNVYVLVKSIVDTFSTQTQSQFSRVVLVEYPRRGCHTLGFVTGEMKGDTGRIASNKVINVFVPTVPSPISGYLLLLSESEVIPITLDVEEAMKMVVSCGMYNPALLATSSPSPAST